MKKVILTSILSGLLLVAISCGGSNNDKVATQQKLQENQQSVLYKKGSAVFMSKCSMCHDFNEKLVGPPLKGVMERWGNDEEKLVAFIKNANKVIKSGDPYAVNLYNEWGKTDMPNFEYLSDEDMKAIIEYLK
jgi:cytochrome c551/c552